ncbi:Uma2 family endonuclease [Tautonia marina]|uniref:Uma2 family endonuclease n=1 Tax=Tautonia marina TaxID=2653855 RepID=UPI001260E502|nr:Uma2 family endonuclease [Tautonia marina]
MATATRSPNPATPPPSEALDARPARVQFTVDDYHRLAELGFLHEDSRIELIEGDLIAISPIGPRHADVVDRLVEILVPLLVGRAIVRVQNPLRLDDHSEPEPDLMIVKRREGGYASAHPRPSDVLLLIEVMDSSSDYDRGTKLGLYARFGVTEVWLIDLIEQRIAMHRTPNHGIYTERLIRSRGQTVAPTALPDVELDVDALLGPAEPGPLPPPRT